MYTITDDTSNKDLFMNMSREEGRKYYLDLWGDFQTRFALPIVEEYKGKYILRADKSPRGMK